MPTRPILCQVCGTNAEVVAGVYPAECAHCGTVDRWRIDWLQEMPDDPIFDAGDKRILAALNIAPK